MNVYDRQLAADGRILRALGLVLKRDGHGVAKPAPVPVAAVNAKVSHSEYLRLMAATRSSLDDVRRIAA